MYRAIFHFSVQMGDNQINEREVAEYTVPGSELRTFSITDALLSSLLAP